MKRILIPAVVLALCATASAQGTSEWKNEAASAPYADNYIPPVASGYSLVKRIALDSTYDLSAVQVVGWDRGVSGDVLQVRVMADNNGLPDSNRILFQGRRSVTVDGRIHAETVPTTQPVHLNGTVWVAVQMERAMGYVSYDPFRSDTDFLWDGSMIGKAVVPQGDRSVVSRGGSLERTYSLRLHLVRTGGDGPPRDEGRDHGRPPTDEPRHWWRPPMGDGYDRGRPPVDRVQEMLDTLDGVFRARTKSFRVRPSKNFFYWADDQASHLGAIYVPFWLEGVSNGDQVTVRVEGIPEDFQIDAGGELTSLLIGPHNGYGMRGLYYRLYDGRRYFPMVRYNGWSERAGSIDCSGICGFDGISYTGGGTIEVSFRVARSMNRSFRGYLILGVDDTWTRDIQKLMLRQR